MPRPECLLGLLEGVDPGELEARLGVETARGRRVHLVDLLPGCLKPELAQIAHRHRLPVLSAGERFDSTRRGEVEYAAAALTRRVMERVSHRLELHGVSFAEVVFHIYFWYMTRPALISLAVLEGLLDERDWEGLTILGGDAPRAELLGGVCRRRGVDFRAPGRHHEPLSRRLSYARRLSSHSPVLSPGLAQRLQRFGGLLSSRPLRGLRPLDLLLLPVTAADSQGWLPVAEKLPGGTSWGVAAVGGGLLAGYPGAAALYDLRGGAWERGLRRWTEGYRRLETVSGELPGLFEGLGWRGYELSYQLQIWMLFQIRLLIWRLLPITAALERLLDELRPSLVVALSERDTTALLAFQLARSRGIPSLALESHDMVYGSPIFQRPLADRMALSGPASRSVYLDHGAEESGLVVTGQPRYDRLVRLGREPTGRWRKKLTDRPRLVVVFSQPTDVTLPLELKRELMEGAAALSGEPGLEVLVKPHPREDRDALTKLMEEAGLSPRDNLTPDGLDLYELLAGCDVVVTAFSTVGVEALIMGRPVVCLRRPDSAQPLEYVDSGAVTRAGDAAELAAAVRRILSGPEDDGALELARREYLAGHEAAVDGRATDRVAGLIGEMMGDGR